MFQYCQKENLSNVTFKTERMNNLEEKEEFDLALSIGVMHNATTIKEFIDSFKEIYRILRKNGYSIISIFTNDVITPDLIQVNSSNLYLVKDRQPMILLGKNEISKILREVGFKSIREIDEHVTEVGGDGKRNVWTILLQK